jgi:hypothetical protein
MTPTAYFGSLKLSYSRFSSPVFTLIHQGTISLGKNCPSWAIAREKQVLHQEAEIT